MPASHKTGPTYYTPERVASARENLDRYDWAKALFQRIREGDGFRYYIGPKYGPADTYVEQSDDFMWMLQPTTRIGRVLPPESIAICPVHGTAVRGISPFCPYAIDPINKPYKIQCLMGGEWYPSNDYAAGDMTSGEFPDDGNGCEYNGHTYYFLREYAHMAYGSTVIPALRSLSQAYTLTGDAKYGRKGAVLLARLASEYPNHDDRTDRLHFAHYGGRSPKYDWKTGGMITDLIWETFCLEGAVYAYDGLYTYLDKDPDLLAFLKAKDMPIETGNDLRLYIEKYLLRAGMIGLLNGDIHGNEGHHQAAALACALVLDDYTSVSPNSTELVDYAFHGEGHAAYLLINGLTRDGGGHESPGYNQIKFDFIRVARAMEDIRARRPDLFPTDRYPDIFAGDKARRLFDHFIDLTLLDSHLSSIGDSGGIGPVQRSKPSFYSLVHAENLYAFNRYNNPRHARAATDMDGNVAEGELFEPYPADRIEAVLKDPTSQIKRESRLLDGYGIGILESGEGDHRRALSLNYTSLLGHRQCDNLSLEFFARGLNLLPDLGYPKSWDYRWQWDGNSLAHNTVTVDETQPAQDIGGQARLFASVNGVHVITAAHNPYPEGRYKPASSDAPHTDLYERTTILVDVDPQRFYAIDLFAVNGGSQHDQSWHALLSDVQHPDLEWTVQKTGTLAGPNVEPFTTWTDRWNRKRDDFPAFLTSIQTAPLDHPATWTWQTGLPEGDAVRLHIVPVGSPLEILSGQGRSPVWPEDEHLPYILARHQSKNGEPSLFLTVLETYQNTPVIQNIRLVSTDPLQLEITRADGTDHIDLNIPLTSGPATEHRPLGLRVQTPDRNVSIGHWAPDKGPGYIQAAIEAVDYDNNRIALAIKNNANLEPGHAIRIYNKGRSALYRITGTQHENGLTWITLDGTALMARGPVSAIEDGRISLDAHLTFAMNSPLTKDKDLAPGPNSFAGAWLGEGKTALQLRGAAQHRSSQPNSVFLQDNILASELERTLKDQVVSIWQYGVGDRAEIVCIEE
ncbi:MAG: heparinase II/III family protein [bacterium]|nr:heparinase II/III family protein [bacterium]